MNIEEACRKVRNCINGDTCSPFKSYFKVNNHPRVTQNNLFSVAVPRINLEVETFKTSRITLKTIWKSSRTVMALNGILTLKPLALLVIRRIRMQQELTTTTTTEDELYQHQINHLRRRCTKTGKKFIPTLIFPSKESVTKSCRYSKSLI